ncbi:hypothetical protein EYF80_020900 [Liparis tanakae]|uniref:Uncharacterized protein n=1 Tax=Liparis tanakae TaxID=230148 RepID=A0A4Z2HU63_9TELE|nr:hypothetical protein EYF80_020900 [Liparis tanakae]
MTKESPVRPPPYLTDGDLAPGDSEGHRHALLVDAEAVRLARLWMALVLWLGLGRKPEESPEVEEGERDGAALLGVLRGLLEVEQLRAGSCGAAGGPLTSNKNGAQWTSPGYVPQSGGGSDYLEVKGLLNCELKQSTPSALLPPKDCGPAACPAVPLASTSELQSPAPHRLTHGVTAPGGPDVTWNTEFLSYLGWFRS